MVELKEKCASKNIIELGEKQGCGVRNRAPANYLSCVL